MELKGGNNKRVTLSLLVCALILSMLASCSGTKKPSDTQGSQADSVYSVAATGETDVDTGTADESQNLPSVTAEITLNGTSAQITGDTVGAVDVNGSVITVKNPGSYTFSGSLDDGCIIVETDKKYEVEIILNGVTLKNLTTAPFYVKSADKVSLVLADGTENVLTDASVYKYEGTETKPNACLYSSDDLSIKGDGTLTVNANYNNGIGCKNDLKIKSGIITVTAVNNAIKGVDSVTVSGGTINILACEDGIKTDNDKDEGKGIILVEEGDITIHSSDDALQATKKVTVSGGHITTFAEGDTVNCDGSVNVKSGCLTEN